MSDARQVGIVGLGALGGSLARALTERPSAPRVAGWARDAADVEAAAHAGRVRGARDARDAVDGADLVVLAVPLGAEAGLLGEVASALAPDAVVVDVGSLQAPALAAARQAGVPERFVACHPMAGTAETGFAAGRADLFDGARVWLSAPPEVGSEPRRRVEAVWSSVGGLPAWIDPDEHDERMVAVSHLPQVVANALAGVLEAEGVTPSELGPGGLDMTRLATSSPAMWLDLFEHSGPRLIPLLRRLRDELSAWEAELSAGRVDTVGRRMDATARWRRT